MHLRCRFVLPEELGSGDVEAWNDLARRTAEPNVFYEPDVLLPAMRHLEPPGVVRLAVVEGRDGTWMACAPVRRVRAWGRLRLPCLTLWTHDFSGLEVPLIDRDAVLPALTALLEALRRPRGGVFVAFTQLPVEGPVHTALPAAAGGSQVEVARYARAVLHRRPEFAYLDDLRPKRRSELARSRRRLEERHEGVETVDVSDDPAAVDWFLELEASGWKGDRGTAMASNPGATAFFREACAALRRRGRLELLALMADGRPIAMKCNFATTGRVFGFKQAFDESMSRYSPGKLLDIDTMRSFHDHADADMLDTIASATNTSINGMWPDRLELATVLVPARGPVGGVARAALSRVLRRPGPVAAAPAPGPLDVAGRAHEPDPELVTDRR